jgi:hypothetical protein
MKISAPGSYRAAFLAVAVGWLVFSLPWLSGSVTIPYDAKAHFQPQLQFLAHALHTGQSPFWTPNVFGGSPQIADPQSLIFSPAILLAVLNPTPSFWDLDLFCFALLGIAAVSALFFFKDRGWHPAGATVAALAIAFGGSSAWRIQHVKQIESFAFFMLCFWLLARALDRKSLLYGILAGLAAAVMIIEPGQVAMLGCYLLGAYTVHFWLNSPSVWGAVKSSLRPLVAGGLTAGVLAVIPILMTYLFVESSNRPDVPYNEAVRGSLHPASLLTAVVPDLYSAHSNSPYWGPGSLVWPADYLALSENMAQVYIGALPILLILAFGILGGRAWMRDIRFFAGCGVFLIVYALGRYTPLFPLLYYYTPGVDLFRRPADATYALGAVAAIISGYLLHRILTDEDRLSYRGVAASLAVLAALFATCASVAYAKGELGFALRPIMSAALFFTGGAALLFLARRYDRAYGALTIAAVGAFMTLDLAVNNGPNRSTAKRPQEYDAVRVDTKNETVAFLKAHLDRGANDLMRDRVELVGLGFEWPNIGLIHDFDHVLGYNPVRLEEVVDSIGANEDIAEAYQRKFPPLFPSYRSMMADLLGLRYIATRQPIEAIDKKLQPGDLRLVARQNGTYIYENPHALPRILFAFDWMPANFDSLVKTGLWPHFDPKTTVLLDTPPANSQLHLSMAQPIARMEARTTLQSYTNTEIEILVRTPKPGFVVLNDVWHPWWFGSVDGKPANVLRANVVFRAIQVPAGVHLVRFEFRPVAGAFREIMRKLKPGDAEPLPAPRRELPPELRPEARTQAVLSVSIDTQQKPGYQASDIRGSLFP